MDKTEYKRAFDSVSAPVDASARVLSRISSRKRPSSRRAALVLCAVLALTCTAALASGVAGEWMSALIAMNGQSVPEGNLQAIGQTAEADGVRITLTEAVSDGTNVYLLIDVEALEGQSFLPSDTLPVEESLWLTERIAPQIGGGFRFTRLDDGENAQNARMTLEYSFDEPIAGREITVTITSLETARDQVEDGIRSRIHEKLAEGEWTFCVQIQNNMEIVRYAMGDCQVSVSALGLTIEGMGDESLLDGSLVLRMTDGSEVELTHGGVSRTSRNGQTTSQAYRARLSRLIDPAQAAAIVLDGEEYSLTQLL